MKIRPVTNIRFFVSDTHVLKPVKDYEQVKITNNSTISSKPIGIAFCTTVKDCPFCRDNWFYIYLNEK